MKAYKTFLHLWITAASLLSFLGGWALLAHSRKPIQPVQTTTVNIAPMPTLPPIQFFNGEEAGGGLNFVTPNKSQPIQQSAPLLMTGGS
jgi:hypothetical protein